MSINRKFNTHNPHYNPEACGLRLIDCLDKSSGCYEFAYLVVWQDIPTGSYYYATDSGCSCPEPFGDIHCLADLTEIKDIYETERVFLSWLGNSKEGCSKLEVQALIDSLREALKGEFNESLAK